MLNFLASPMMACVTISLNYFLLFTCVNLMLLIFILTMQLPCFEHA